MLKNYFLFALAGILILTTALTPALAGSKAKEASPVEKIKAKVAKRGVGEKARVSVRMQNGTQLKGYVSQAGEDSFVVTDSKTGQATTIAYREVEKVKGKGLSTAAKIGIGVAIGVGATVAALALALRGADFGPICCE